MALANSVINGWRDFIEPYEGETNYIYMDTHKPRYPTTGIGNLLGDNENLFAWALALPFRFKDGEYANEADIKREFQRIKGLNIPPPGQNAKPHADLFLDWPVVDWLVKKKLASNQPTIKKSFPRLDTFPPPVQLAINNLAWHMGPAFAEPEANGGWPTLKKCINNGDFLGASLVMDEQIKASSDRWAKNSDLFKSGFYLLSTGQKTELADVRSSTVVHPLGGPCYTSIKAGSFKKSRTESWYVQFALAKLNYYTTTLDGDFGPMSDAALKQYGRDNNLTTVSTQLKRLMNDTIFLRVL